MDGLCLQCSVMFGGPARGPRTGSALAKSTAWTNRGLANAPCLEKRKVVPRSSR